MSERFIKTIEKTRVAGNYIEFWFKEDLKIVEDHFTETERFGATECFDACMKIYTFLDLIEKEGIYSDILNYGLKNRKMIWKWSEHKTHLEFVSFLKYTRIVLIEKYEDI